MSDERDFSALEAALQQAIEAERNGDVPVGAVILDPAGAVIGKGFNRREKDQNPVSHAEVEAIREAARNLDSWRLIDCTLVVTLEPCPMCLAACQQARLKRVVYGATDPKGGAISLGYRLHEDVRTNHRFEAVHLPHEASGEILKNFFRRRRGGE